MFEHPFPVHYLPPSLFIFYSLRDVPKVEVAKPIYNLPVLLCIIVFVPRLFLLLLLNENRGTASRDFMLLSANSF